MDELSRLSAETLTTLRLSPLESQILQYLAKNGGSPAGVLAKRLSAKRPNIYFALSKLTERGFVEALLTMGTTFYHVRSVRDLKSILNLEFSRSRSQEQAAVAELDRAWLDLMPSQQEARLLQSSVKVVSSMASYREMLASVLKADRLDAIWAPDNWLGENTEELTRDFLQRVEKFEIPVREILSDGPRARKYARAIRGRNHCVKFLSGARFPGDVNIGSHVATISQLEPSLFGVSLAAPEIVRSLRAWFDALWELLPASEGRPKVARIRKRRGKGAREI